MDDYKSWMDPRYLDILRNTLAKSKNEDKLTAYSIHSLIEAYREYIMGYAMKKAMKSVLCENLNETSPGKHTLESMDISLPLDLIDIIVSYAHNAPEILKTAKRKAWYKYDVDKLHRKVNDFIFYEMQWFLKGDIDELSDGRGEGEVELIVGDSPIRKSQRKILRKASLWRIERNKSSINNNSLLANAANVDLV